MTVTTVAQAKLQVSLSLAMLAIGAGLLGVAVAHGGGTSAAVKVRDGGTFRITTDGIGAPDPATRCIILRPELDLTAVCLKR